MNRRADLEALLETTTREHRDLLGSLRGVEQILEATFAPATGDLSRQLESLQRELSTHFAEEDRSDFYARYPERYPEVADELRSLQAEHAPFLGELSQLVEETSAAESISLDMPLAIRIRSLVARLRRHEAAESALIHRLLASTPAAAAHPGS